MGGAARLKDNPERLRWKKGAKPEFLVSIALDRSMDDAEKQRVYRALTAIGILDMAKTDPTLRSTMLRLTPESHPGPPVVLLALYRPVQDWDGTPHRIVSGHWLHDLSDDIRAFHVKGYISEEFRDDLLVLRVNSSAKIEGMEVRLLRPDGPVH